jgi:hypothetical protein
MIVKVVSSILAAAAAAAQQVLWLSSPGLLHDVLLALEVMVSNGCNAAKTTRL